MCCVPIVLTDTAADHFAHPIDKGNEVIKGRNRKGSLLPWIILFLVVGGGLIHCAHPGSPCGFSQHNDIKHHQITSFHSCMMVISILFIFLFISPVFFYPMLKEGNKLQPGYLILPFRPPR